MMKKPQTSCRFKNQECSNLQSGGTNEQIDKGNVYLHFSSLPGGGAVHLFVN